MSEALSMDERKALGAFYTDEEVAKFLVAWALRTPGRSVMDPACGDGRFLGLAHRQRASRLVACDISADAIAAARRTLHEIDGGVEYVTSDFFAVEPDRLEAVDAVVGNPPFIRYQKFSGESRRRALRSALGLGVRLSQLTSSWAPFLLHAVHFLRRGGDLAMVVPAEILRTHYGRETLRALMRRFSALTLITFEDNLFPDAQAETCLLLAEELGGSCESIRLIPLVSIGDLPASFDELRAGSQGVVVPFKDDNLVRFAEAFLTQVERQTWRRVRRHSKVACVASFAKVTNGYVTGDNEFFHRTLEAARTEGYPRAWLFPVARSARSLRGLSYTRDDLAALESEGRAHHLVVPQEDLFGRDPEALDRFLQEGTERGTPLRYKCRVRNPWWRVPGLVPADVLVGYMAGHHPRAAVNRAAAMYPNSLHGLQLRGEIAADQVTLGFHCSLTLLSLEIEGRSYGGGVLKLEPRELERVLVPCPDLPPARVAQSAARVDDLLRAGDVDAAVQSADDLLLIEGLGFAKTTVAHLRRARNRLVQRRMGRAG